MHSGPGEYQHIEFIKCDFLKCYSMALYIGKKTANVKMRSDRTIPLRLC